MSWTNLDLATEFWADAYPGEWPPARVKPLASQGNAQLEGYLTYSGGTAGAPITIGAGLPAGCYDTGKYHSIEGRCLDSSGHSLGTCEILIDTTGNLGTAYMPSGTAYMYFGAVYPVN
jgi:hypothetical protein